MNGNNLAAEEIIKIVSPTSNPVESDGQDSPNIEEFVCNVVAGIRNRSTTLFLGAGISGNSGIPIVSKIVHYILKKLGLSEKDIETYMKAGYPFESFIETLEISCNIDRLLDVFKGGKPNTNHILIAKLVKKGYLKNIVSTTNFDTLIEQALKEEDLEEGKDFEVLHKEEDFDSVDWSEDKFRLIKIHGTIADKKNLGVTINRLASKYFSQQRQSVINHVFAEGKHENVMILGYSSSDVFDINLHIQAIDKGSKNIIYLEHHPTPDNEHRNAGDTEHIKAQGKKNPFNRFEGYRVFYHTDKLVEEIWKKLFMKEEYENRKYTKEWIEDVDVWFQEERLEITKYVILGSLFERISQFKTAGKYCEKSRNIEDKKQKTIVLITLGNVYFGLGVYTKAIKYNKQALKILKSFGDQQQEGTILSKLGIDYYALGKYEKAMKYHEQALQIAIVSEDLDGKSYSLSYLGILHNRLGKYEKALKCHVQSLEINEVIGNKYAEGNDYTNLGNAHDNLGNYPKALRCHEHSLQIAINLGNKQAEGDALGNLGNVYSRLMNFPKAIEYNMKALEIKKIIGSKQGEVTVLLNLGIIHSALGEYQKAMKYYEQALPIAGEIKDKDGEERILMAMKMTKRGT